MNLKHILSGAALLGAMMASQAINTSQMVAHDLTPMPLLGTLAPDAKKQYSRLPDSLKSQIRDELWGLGLNSAGMAIRFRSDATSIGAKWTSLSKFNMSHMTATGIRGVDLYVMEPDGTWTTMAAGKPSFNEHTTSALLMPDMTREMREYMLYLPLYDGVDSVYIYTDSAAVVELPAVNLPVREKPLVMYGTSLLQGGCASRPGMVHTSILERMLNREVVNLGFSGNARLDPEIARLMAQADAGLYVIDPLPNCTPEMVEERASEFIGIIRASRPETPILLIESPTFPICRFNGYTDSVIRLKNKNLHDIYTELSKTDPNLYYMPTEEVLTDEEATVDNFHFTDTGFVAYARAMLPHIKRILGL